MNKKLVKHNSDLSPLRGDFFSGMDALMNDLWNSFPGNSNVPSIFATTGYPRFNIEEFKDKFTIEATVPGMTKEDLSLSIKDDTLTIKGNKQEQKEQKSVNVICHEIKKSGFCRSISLGDNVDVEKISTSLKDGILTINLPKKEAIKKENYIELEIT